MKKTASTPNRAKFYLMIGVGWGVAGGIGAAIEIGHIIGAVVPFVLCTLVGLIACGVSGLLHRRREKLVSGTGATGGLSSGEVESLHHK